MTTATTTARPDALALVGRLTELLLTWSYSRSYARATPLTICSCLSVPSYLGASYVLTPGSHGLRGFESRLGGHPIEGFRGLSDMVSLFTALAVAMLVAAAAVRSVGQPLSWSRAASRGSPP